MKIEGLLLGAAVLVFTAVSCKKDSKPGPSTKSDGTSYFSFTANGDGFGNQLITINGVKTATDNVGFYSTKYNYTEVQIGDQKDTDGDSDNSIDITFDGNAAGKIPYNVSTNPKHVDIVMSLTNAGAISVYGSPAANQSGTVNITKYGAVGDDITGDFSGTFFNEITHKVVTITNGHFKVKRADDFTLKIL